jgi:arachidonate 15-lipoxygenase (second type) / 8-lipoxygenase (S-type)
VPEGLDPGMLSNYTKDLLFSMERLSVNPYSVRRLHPTQDSLPFVVDNGAVKYVTGVALESLHASGSLFYADHRSQARLQKTIRYAAACDAYFYIHPTTSDFLPLAIRPNGGSNLTYTPLDTPNDWLLAKMMFNLNDFWYGQMYHFVATHEVVEIVYEAAIRTLSDNHPVLAILNRSKFLHPESRDVLTFQSALELLRIAP